MRWTPEKRQVIEAGVWALMVADAQRVESIRCGWCPSATHTDAGYHWSADPASHMPSRRTDDMFASVASGYLFTLEAVNNTEWGEIVRAASEADAALALCPCAHHDKPTPRGLDCVGCCSAPWEKWDAEAGRSLATDLFSALLLEGLAKGEQETYPQCGHDGCDMFK